jgi:hypothetical protein
MPKTNTVKKSAPKFAPRAKTLSAHDARREAMRASAEREAKAEADRKAKKAVHARRSYEKRKAAKLAEKLARETAAKRAAEVAQRPAPATAVRRGRHAPAAQLTPAVGKPVQLELPGISKAQFVATLEVQLAAELSRATRNDTRIDTLKTTIRIAKLLA